MKQKKITKAFMLVIISVICLILAAAAIYIYSIKKENSFEGWKVTQYADLSGA